MSADPSYRTQYGPTALVVGGTDGLGLAFARALASRGLDLVLVARRGSLLEEVSRSISSEFSVSVQTFALDMADQDAQRELVLALKDKEIGLLVCNAAVSPVGPFLDQPLETHDKLVELNCHAASHLACVFGKLMRERRRGGLVFVSSMAGFQGTAQVVHYAASKAYLRVLAEGLWEELRPHGVHALACVAGQVDTPTFVRSQPRHPAWMPVPVMQPDAVVAQALAALGKQPTVIPGLSNRLASFFTQRLLPRKTIVSFYSASTRAMYPTDKQA
ncbi:MAG TPA: SDR family NAD(P)-dependent oxidoreductase [Myxococcales bacterium]